MPVGYSLPFREESTPRLRLHSQHWRLGRGTVPWSANHVDPAALLPLLKLWERVELPKPRSKRYIYIYHIYIELHWLLLDGKNIQWVGTQNCLRIEEKRCLLSFFGTHPYNICFELKPKKHIFKYFKGLKLQSTASCNISLSSPLWCSWHQANPACWPRSNKQPHKAVLLLGDVFLSSGDHGFTMSFPFYSKLT